MTSSQSCRENELNLMFSPKASHFFKIVLQDSISHGKLIIPRKFVQRCENDLPNHMLIKVPNGAVWQVELRKRKNEAWLQKGWPEFAEFYSLAHGYFLVFEYKGNCDFHVLIFDKTAMEIEYPPTKSHNNKKTDYDGECKKNREKSPLPCPHPCKVMKNNSSKENKRNIRSLGPGIKFEDEILLSSNNVGRGMSMATGQRSSQAGFIGRTQQLTSYAKAKALERASAFQSKNPFFKVFIQPSHKKKDAVTVPVNFARKYFTKRNGDVVLCISDGRSWPARYRQKLLRGYPWVPIFGGWKAFAVDNYLEVGDVCVFELINPTDISFKVVIFRLTEDVKCQPPGMFGRDVHKKSPGGVQSTRGNLNSRASDPQETGSELVLINPFFKVVLRLHHLNHSRVYIPASFVRRYMNMGNDTRTVMLQVADRTWPVKLVSSPSEGKAVLSAGWSAFAKGNSLVVGDVCVFELINNGVLNVFICRKFGC